MLSTCKTSCLVLSRMTCFVLLQGSILFKCNILQEAHRTVVVVDRCKCSCCSLEAITKPEECIGCKEIDLQWGDGPIGPWRSMYYLPFQFLRCVPRPQGSWGCFFEPQNESWKIVPHTLRSRRQKCCRVSLWFSLLGISDSAFCNPFCVLVM